VTRVPLRPSARFADLFGHEVLEPGRQHAVVRLVDARIRVQPVVNHNPIDEIVDDGGDVVDAGESVVERGWLSFPRLPPLASR
jgi:hypothetical protein